MKDKLFVIKGTGLPLDGSVVGVKGIVDIEGDQFALVSPPNTPSDTQNTMVKRACLQPIGSETYRYQITVRKFSEQPLDLAAGETRTIPFDKCIRNVSIDTIVEYLETNLKPILRME